MASVIACPGCSARLKIAKLPSASSKIKCPQCGQSFVIGPNVKAGSPPTAAPAIPFQNPARPVPRAVPSRRSLWLALGIGGVLLLGTGITAAILLTGGRPEEKPDPLVKNKDSASTDDKAKQEQDRLEKEKQDNDRLAKEKAELDRLAKEKTDLERLAKEKADKEKADREKQAKEAENQDRFDQLMEKGRTALAEKKAAEAAAAFEAARELFPGRKIAAQKLKDARDLLAAQAKSKGDDQKKKEDLAKYLSQAQDAMTKKQWTTAIEIYKLALLRVPDSALAVKGLGDAQTALDKDQDEQKKSARFDSHIAAGRAALNAGDYAGAIREFAAAQKIFPFSPQAANLYQQAEGKLGAAADKEQKLKEYNRLSDLAGAAMRNQRFAEAELNYKQILKLFPKDQAAARGLAEAEQGRKIAEIHYNRLMTLGTDALRDLRYRDAIDHFREVNRLFPSDERALQLLRDAERLQENRRIYVLAMKRGNFALKEGRNLDAFGFFAEALKAWPADPSARDALAEAQRRVDIDNRNAKEFDRLDADGKRALTLFRYGDAIKAFGQALKLMPKHPNAPKVASQDRYAEAMANGQTAMNAKRYGEAVKYYQAALVELPDNFVATRNLTQARALNKDKK